MKTIYILILLISVACSKKVELVKLEDYNGKAFQKPVVFFLYSSFSEHNIEQLSLLSRFTIVIVDVEKFPNAISRYDYKDTPILVFVDSLGNNLFTVELNKINDFSDQILNIISEVKNSKLVLSEEELLKGIKLQNISANEQRNIVEVFSQNFNYTQNSNLSFNMSLASLYDYLYKNNPDPELLNNFYSILSKLVLNENLDPVNGGLWSENGNIKQLSSFLKYYNLLFEYKNYLSQDLLKIFHYNFETSFTYFFSFLYDEKVSLYFPSAFYKPSFGLALTEKVLTNSLLPDEISYLEKTFIFSYSNFEDGDRFVRFTNKLSENIDYKLDLINKLRKLSENTIRVGIFREAFSNPNLLMIKILAQFDNSKYNDMSKILLNSVDKKFSDDTGLIKTHSNGVLYLDTQVDYIESLMALYSNTKDASYLNRSIKHANLTLVNFCNSKNKTTFCSDTAFVYLDKYFAYFSLPNYSLEANAKFANTLLKLYFTSKDEDFLNYSYRILSSFYDIASISLENKKITTPLITYLSSLYSLYTYPVYINIYENNKFKEQIIKYSKEIFINNYFVNISEGCPDKKLENEINVCIDTYCEQFNYKNNLEVSFKKFLEDNHNKLTRIINY